MTAGSGDAGPVPGEPFEVAVRGYSRRDVDDFAGRARRQVAALEERLSRALDEAQRLRAELATARQPPVSRPAHEEVSGQIARIFAQAGDEAQARKDRAAQEITKLRSQAQQEADACRAAAVSQTQQLLAAAQEHAERAVTTARAEAGSTTGNAQAEAEAVTADALAQAEAVVAEAAGRSAQLLDEATARAAAVHGGAESRAGQLAGGRAQAMRQLTEIRDVVVGVLEGDTSRGSLADEVASAAAASLAAPGGTEATAPASQQGGRLAPPPQPAARFVTGGCEFGLTSAGPRAPGEIARQIGGLAASGASGAVWVTGPPGGVIYLARGYLAFAESRIIPDVGSRLVNSGQLPARHWSDLLEASEPSGCESCLLLRYGLITAAELKELLRSVTLDALLAMAMQAVSGLPADTSFVPQRPHCAGSVLCMDAGSAWAYAARVGRRLAGHEIRYQARPRLCHPGWPWPAASPGELAVAGQIDGHVTVRDLAWRNGLALHDTVEWIARLTERGLCTIAGRPGSGRSPHHQDAQPRWVTPDRDVLQRVLNGLRRLNVSSAGSGGARH